MLFESSSHAHKQGQLSRKLAGYSSCCFLHSNESHLHARAAGRQVRFVIFLKLRN